MKKWMFCSLIIFGSITLFAANDNIVDLLKILSISQKDTSSVSAFLNLGDYYLYKNADSGITSNGRLYGYRKN